MNKFILPASIVLASLIIGGFFYSSNDKDYPYLYQICDVEGYRCFDQARFKDLDTCQRMDKKYSWYCDETDPSNIVCEEKPSIISSSRCVED